MLPHTHHHRKAATTIRILTSSDCPLLSAMHSATDSRLTSTLWAMTCRFLQVSSATDHVSMAVYSEYTAMLT